ncbi:hypothetical protein L210DRAFT_3727013 [Boletus edulis BED1]|uniref:Uncharacterized protein n=1 Tax=Boletus edulis BED1 TaxID=1328754 RepID=A0AAD4C218_BOLED|nr:hypothetical protein L210DRAFT_3727013 [Boletus edulis BED1]
MADQISKLKKTIRTKLYDLGHSNVPTHFLRLYKILPSDNWETFYTPGSGQIVLMMFLVCVRGRGSGLPIILLLVRRTPLSEDQGRTRSMPVQYEYRREGTYGGACGFDPAKDLVRGLTATPTAVLPDLFRELPATPGELSLFLSHEAAKQRGQSGLSDKSSEPKDRRVSSKNHKRRDERSALKQQRWQADPGWVGVWVGEGRWGVRRLLISAKPVVGATPTDPPGTCPNFARRAKFLVCVRGRGSGLPIILLLVRRTPLSEDQGRTRSMPVQYEYRREGTYGGACGFDPAKDLVRGLTATPTAVLPDLFRELPATPGELSLFLSHEAAKQRGQSGLSDKSSEPKDRRVSSKNHKRRDERSALKQQRWQADPGWVGVWVGEGGWGVRRLLISAKPVVGATPTDPPGTSSRVTINPRDAGPTPSGERLSISDTDPHL